jgi:hypothetical protein
MRPISIFFSFMLIFVLCLQFSCSKTGTSLPPAPPDPCSFISVNINGSVTNPSASGATDGKIIVTATGGLKFTFSINNGTFQTSGIFDGLAAGSYIVVAKNSEGCSGTISFTLINPTISCAGINISVSVTTTPNEVCEPNSASITTSAYGGVAPYTYSLDGGSFQTASVFNNVASGSHIISVKDANGCTGSASTTVNNKPTGVLFAQVKGVIQYSCVSCHKPAMASGGMDFTVDCNIVINKDRIKARAVDGVPSPMPPTGLLFSIDRQKITNWINAGGRYSD